MNMLDLFSGIGGFHKGFEQAGYKLDWVGFSEVDKYSSAVYKHKFKNVKDLGDVRTIQSKDLPKIDLITFGSPCQDFSQASGSRSGLKGHRSSLIRESIRLISECKPHTFIWENVKGTFSSNNGEDFWAIIQAFINIGGYRLEWELLNSRWFQVPQNRERIYLIGHLGRGSGRTVFPLRGASKSASEISLKQIGTIGKDSEATRVYDANGLSKTIKDGGGMGVKTGLYKLQERIRRLTPIECERLQGFPDNFTSKGIINNEVTSISNSQRYKQLGNAVTVNVVQAIAEKLNKIRR
jgi:DNA (cytosine-5)-methyltransferase 1